MRIFEKDLQKIIILMTFPFLAALVISMAYTLWTMDRISTAMNLSDKASNLILECHIIEKDFLLSRSSTKPNEFEAVYRKLDFTIKNLEKFSGLLDIGKVQDINSNLKNYSEAFHLLVREMQVIGTDEDSGLHWKFRDTIHYLEKVFEETTLEGLMEWVLMCRRNEKDFIIRKDPVYLDKFNANYNILSEKLAGHSLDADRKALIQSILENYKTGFIKLAKAMENVGLTNDKGIIGEMNQKAGIISSILLDLHFRIQQLQARAMFWLKIMCVPILILIAHTLVLVIKFMATNNSLKKESDKKEKAQHKLVEINEELEANVESRTRELTLIVEKLEKRNFETRLINKLNDHLQVCLTKEEIYPIVRSYLKRLFPGASGAVFLYNASRNHLARITGWGEGLDSNSVFLQDDCWGLRQGKTYCVTREDGTPLCAHIKSKESCPYICEPLTAQGEVVGLLCLQFASPGNSEDANAGILETKELTIKIAEHLALSIAMLNLRHKLHYQSIRDPLTGLFNRRYLEETLNREIRRAERKELNLAVVMMDIDHFKKYNDTYGHDAGDIVLSKLGSFLKENIRAEDIACRYGGEEFVLIFPDMDDKSSINKSNDLMTRIRDLEFVHKNNLLKEITVSMGIAVFSEQVKTPENLLKKADDALYQAKANGRNQVVLSGKDAGSTHGAGGA